MAPATSSPAPAFEPDATIASVLGEQSARHPDAPFLLAPSSTLSYGEADRQSCALAAALTSLGVRRGERIALILPACPEFAIAALAAARMGACIVPVHPRQTRTALRYMLRHSGASCAVTAENLFGTDFVQLFEGLLEDLPELGHVVTVGEEDLWYDDQIFQWEDLISAGSGRALATPQVSASDPFAIVYGGGAEGKPKGVELTHGSLLHGARAAVRAMDMTRGDVVVGVGALTHVFGLGPGLLGTLLSGASLVLAGDTGASETLDLADRHRATVHYGVPSAFAREVREIERRGRRPGAIRLCVASGAPLRDDLAGRIEDAFGAPVISHYSLTEASSTLAMARPQDPRAKRVSTVGRIVEDTVVRVTEDDGSELPSESVGEIRVRGPGVMRGYFRQPKATAEAMDGQGYLRTGDIGMVDEEGYLHVLGRRQDVVIRGGFNVHPREVEDRLAAHPAVERGAAVGVSDDILGEALCACVIRVEGGVVTEDEIRDWCGAALGDYKVPDRVIFMEELPLTGSGTVWRQELSRRISAGSSG